MNIRRFLRAMLSLLLLGALSQSALAEQTISRPAPDFTLSSKGGPNLRLSEQLGNVVLINFWASWCGPCRQEMPILEDIYQKYSPLGFTILGVNVDKDPAKADKILRDISVNFPVLYDPEGNVSKMYNVNAMPTTVIVDRNGKMRYLHLGYKPGYENDYVKQIKTLIRE